MDEVKELRLIPVEDDQRQLWNTIIVFMAVISSDVRDRSHASREKANWGSVPAVPGIVWAGCFQWTVRIPCRRLTSLIVVDYKICGNRIGLGGELRGQVCVFGRLNLGLYGERLERLSSHPDHVVTLECRIGY